jgi:prophage regulatory protein
MEQLLALPEVEKITALRKSTIYRLIQEERFPKGVCVAARSRRWPASQIEAWIAEQISQAA